MQLAHGNHRMALLAQPMMPAGHAPVIRNRIVPVTGLMRITPGGYGGARGAAQRAGGVGILEAHAGGGDAVDARRFYKSVAVTAGYCAIVIVGLEEDQVGGLSHF